MNLLEETKDDIKSSNHKLGDIVFIGSRKSGHSCTWKEFETLADIEYDNGYGGQEVATDLIIVFEDGVIMSRGEYDGSEWWEWTEPFVMPDELKPISKIVSGICNSLKDMNEDLYKEKQ